MRPRFLLDGHISPRVAAGCRGRAVDAISLADTDLLEADDLTIFRFAVREGRIVVTYDTGDFARLFGDLLKEGMRIPGVVFVSSRSITPSDTGGLVKALAKLARLIDKGDVDPSGGIFLTR